MPSGSYKQIEVQCPFYKYDHARRITCEGLVDDSTLSLSYMRIKDYETQLSVFCCEHYKKCEVYTMLMAAKYDEED